MVKRCNPLTLLGNGGVGCSEVVKSRGDCASFDSATSQAGAGRMKGHRKGQNKAGYAHKSSVMKGLWAGYEILPFLGHLSVGMWLIIYGEDAW